MLVSNLLSATYSRRESRAQRQGEIPACARQIQEIKRSPEPLQTEFGPGVEGQVQDSRAVAVCVGVCGCAVCTGYLQLARGSRSSA